MAIIAQTEEDGLPVIYRLAENLPPQELRARFSWLTVVSWKYDRTVRNGMPPVEVNSQMVSLEGAIEILQAREFCQHAYSRTGNGLKEFAYYITDREEFMVEFNEALHTHPKYPLAVTFYHDPDWEDLREIRELFQRH